MNNGGEVKVGAVASADTSFEAPNMTLFGSNSVEDTNVKVADVSNNNVYYEVNGFGSSGNYLGDYSTSIQIYDF